MVLHFFLGMTVQSLNFCYQSLGTFLPPPMLALLDTNLKWMLNGDQSNDCGPHP